ncbi:Urease accessory protein UreD [Paraconexibacter sp. AEG42_29]|uniref:Urease accessory protein UreD n=1 Tax=Paraconexibacter sp. AEG42_29 TaxID=2997339 RepID=A0AAU7B180_9ACTN
MVTRVGGRTVVRELRSGLPIGLRQLRGWAGASLGEAAVRVGIVQTGAMLVGGDDVRLEVDVGPGASLVLQDISATLAHPMAPGVPAAAQSLDVRVADGARVVIAEEPLVIAHGARVRRSVRLALEGSASAVHRDTLVLGRHGEPGGAVRTRTRVERDDRPVLDDGLDTGDPGVSASPAVLGGARVLSSLAAFGLPSLTAGDDPRIPDDAFVLGPGDVLVRRIGGTVRGAGLDHLLTRWSAACDG